MRQEISQAWLIPSFNYPAHLVSCDPGLWEVTTVWGKAWLLLTHRSVQAWKMATPADSSFDKWNLKRGALGVMCGAQKSSRCPEFSWTSTWKCNCVQEIGWSASFCGSSFTWTERAPGLKFSGNIPGTKPLGSYNYHQHRMHSTFSPPLLMILSTCGNLWGFLLSWLGSPWTSSSGRGKKPGKLTWFLPHYLWDALVLGWRRRVPISSCYQSSTQSSWGHTSQIKQSPFLGPFKVCFIWGTTEMILSLV